MSAEKNDGGPAFPSLTERDREGDVITEGYYGMSMRDYFAAKALGGMMAYPGNAQSGDAYTNSTPAKIAENCYALADAMIAEGRQP